MPELLFEAATEQREAIENKSRVRRKKLGVLHVARFNFGQALRTEVQALFLDRKSVV